MNFFRAGQHRKAKRFGLFARLDLVAHVPDLIRFRSDKGQSCVRAGLREFWRFGQKSIAGVHSIGTAPDRRLNNEIHVEVALGGERRADTNRPIGLSRWQAVPVGF